MEWDHERVSERGGQRLAIKSGIRNEPKWMWSQVWTHTNVDNDLGTQQEYCVLWGGEL